jgi:hypothetical protein
VSLVLPLPQAVNMSEETATKIKTRLIFTRRFYNWLGVNRSIQVRGLTLLASETVAPGFRIAFGGLES